jgi:hypothetical protein
MIVELAVIDRFLEEKGLYCYIQVVRKGIVKFQSIVVEKVEDSACMRSEAKSRSSDQVQVWSQKQFSRLDRRDC